MPQTAQQFRKQVCRLVLTDPERRDLMRLMHRVLEEVEMEKRSYRVLAHDHPLRGRVVKFTAENPKGEDVTEQNLLDEAAARRFLFLARLK